MIYNLFTRTVSGDYLACLCTLHNCELHCIAIVCTIYLNWGLSSTACCIVCENWRNNPGQCSGFSLMWRNNVCYFCPQACYTMVCWICIIFQVSHNVACMLKHLITWAKSCALFYFPFKTTFRFIFTLIRRQKSWYIYFEICHNILFTEMFNALFVRN